MFFSREKKVVSKYIENLSQTPTYALSVKFTIKQLDYSQSTTLEFTGNELWSRKGAPLGDPMAPVTIEMEVCELEEW